MTQTPAQQAGFEVGDQGFAAQWEGLSGGSTVGDRLTLTDDDGTVMPFWRNETTGAENVVADVYTVTKKEEPKNPDREPDYLDTPATHAGFKVGDTGVVVDGSKCDYWTYIGDRVTLDEDDGTHNPFWFNHRREGLSVVSINAVAKTPDAGKLKEIADEEAGKEEGDNSPQPCGCTIQFVGTDEDGEDHYQAVEECSGHASWREELRRRNEKIARLKAALRGTGMDETAIQTISHGV